MASTEHLLQQPVDSQLTIAIAIAAASSSSSPSSSCCKKRPHPQHRHALAPSPKRRAASSDSPPHASSPALPSASCVSPATPSSPSPLDPSSSSSSPPPSSSSSNHHCSLAAQSFKHLHEELSDFDASCLVDLDESEAAMSSSRQQLLSEMMKTLEQVLGGDGAAHAASDGVPINFSPSSASAHAVSAARVAEISEACIAMGGDQGVTRPEPGAMESEARAELPSQATMSEKERPLVEDCNSSASDLSEICKAGDRFAVCEFGILRASRDDDDDDEDPGAELLPSPSPSPSAPPPTFLSSASLSPDLTTETIETRKSFENLAKEESLESPEACEDLLKELLAEASRNELFAAAHFDSEQEIHAEEWEAVYCSRDSRAQSSESAADPFSQGVCFNGDNDDEAVSRDMLLCLPLETCLF